MRRGRYKKILRMVGLFLKNTMKRKYTWKSVPATKDCDMDKDKGCKITKPDKIGKETIYLLKNKLLIYEKESDNLINSIFEN